MLNYFVSKCTSRNWDLSNDSKICKRKHLNKFQHAEYNPLEKATDVLWTQGFVKKNFSDNPTKNRRWIKKCLWHFTRLLTVDRFVMISMPIFFLCNLRYHDFQICNRGRPIGVLRKSYFGSRYLQSWQVWNSAFTGRHTSFSFWIFVFNFCNILKLGIKIPNLCPHWWADAKTTKWQSPINHRHLVVSYEKKVRHTSFHMEK